LKNSFILVVVVNELEAPSAYQRQQRVNLYNFSNLTKRSLLSASIFVSILTEKVPTPTTITPYLVSLLFPSLGNR